MASVQLYRTFVQNYSARMGTNDFMLKSSIEEIEFAVPKYGLAAITVIIGLADVNMPLQFEKNRKEYIEQLEKTTPTSNTDMAWLDFLKKITPVKARINIQRYLNVVTPECAECMISHYIQIYQQTQQFKQIIEGEDVSSSGSIVLNQTLEGVLDTFFPK